MDNENKIMQTAPPVDIQRFEGQCLQSEDKQILHCFKPEGHTRCGSANVTAFIVIAGKSSFVVGFFELNF